MNANGVSGMKFAPGRFGKALTESRLAARRCIFEDAVLASTSTTEVCVARKRA